MTNAERPESLPDSPSESEQRPSKLTWAALSPQRRPEQPIASRLDASKSKDRANGQDRGASSSRPVRHDALPDTVQLGDPLTPTVAHTAITSTWQPGTFQTPPLTILRELAPAPTLTRLGMPVVQPAFPLPTERGSTRGRRTIPPLLGDDPLDPEIYRQIFTALELPKNAALAVIGVTSAIRGEGRTTIALGLATTLAFDLDIPVTLVEADLEHPSLAEVLHCSPSPGLAAVLREEFQLRDVVSSLPVRYGPLSLIPAGKAGKNIAPLLRRLAMQDPFRGLHGLTGLVILDLPPVVNTSFGAPTAGLADATILVVRAGVTPHQLVREAIARLEENPPQGVVFNAFRSAIPRWWPGRQW